MSELLFVGGSIEAIDDAIVDPDAVLARNGKIEFVGSEKHAREYASSDCEIVDLEGRVLLPGFIDAHSHPLWAAKTRGAPVVDIRAGTVPTFDAVIAKIKRRVAEEKPGAPLLFFGLDAQLHTDMCEPTRAALDEIAPDNPLGVQTSNCHALYLNSAGFDLCGINENTKTPKSSIIERDETGRPTGKIAEAVTWQALETFYQSWGDDRLNEEFEASINQFIRNGITTTTEHLYLPFYRAYFENALRQAWPLPRIAAYQQALSADMAVEHLNIDDDRLWTAGVKIHADGSPFVGNIWLTEPYLENATTLQRMDLRPGHTGSMNLERDYLAAMIEAYFEQGWQVSIHTQGDKTIDAVLDIVEDVLKRTNRPDHRLRLEHCALMRHDQIERAVALGVLSSFFINHISFWGAPIEDVLFGPERAARYMPAGSAVRAGMRISLHADTPMTDPSALALMHAGVTRTANDGRVLGPDERLDGRTALKAITIDAAYHIGMEDRLGSITPGKHADFVVLDANPLHVAPEELLNLNVRETYLAGARVWRSEDA